MCGIAGIAGPGITNFDLEILNQLAYISGLRGMDSTGVFQGKTDINVLKPNHKVLIQKNSLDVSFFLRYHRLNKNGNHEVLSDIFNNFFCVHTRAATRGAINTDNAHPFEFDRFIGCHNGTLMDAKYTSKDKTDSELFIKDIDERGILPVLRELDPDSAYVLVLYNKETGELSFVRNIKRPLYVAHHAVRPVMYWASEKEALEFIAERNNLTLLENEVKYFQPHQVYTVNPARIPARSGKIFTITPFAPKPPKTNYTEWNREALHGWQARQDAKRNETGNQTDIIDAEVILSDKDKQQQAKIAHLRLVPRISIPKPKKGIIKNISLDKTVTIPKETRVPEHYCCSCMKPMTPLEQYYAYKVSDNIYVHAECQAELEDQLLLPKPEHEIEKEVHVG